MQISKRKRTQFTFGMLAAVCLIVAIEMSFYPRPEIIIRLSNGISVSVDAIGSDFRTGRISCTIPGSMLRTSAIFKHDCEKPQYKLRALINEQIVTLACSDNDLIAVVDVKTQEIATDISSNKQLWSLGARDNGDTQHR